MGARMRGWRLDAWASFVTVTPCAASSWEVIDCTALTLCWKEQLYVLPQDLVCRCDTVWSLGKWYESCLGTEYGVGRFQCHPGDSAQGLGALSPQGRATPPTRPGRGQTSLAPAKRPGILLVTEENPCLASGLAVSRLGLESDETPQGRRFPSFGQRRPGCAAYRRLFVESFSVLHMGQYRTQRDDSLGFRTAL